MHERPVQPFEVLPAAVESPEHILPRHVVSPLPHPRGDPAQGDPGRGEPQKHHLIDIHSL